MLLALLLGGVTVALRPEATVRGTEIELRHVATVRGEDAAEVERALALRLGYAPAPGYSRLLVAGKLEHELERMLGGLDVTFEGAAACRVTPETSRVLGTAIESSARSEVLTRYEGRDVELELAASIADIEVPSGLASVELRAVSPRTERSGPIDVAVRVMVDGAPYRTVWTRWNLSLWEEASVPTRTIRTGETITLDLLEKRRVRSGGAPADAPLTALAAIGSTAARELEPGRPIRAGDVLRPLLVRRGDTLLLEIRRNHVHARVSVVAEEDARANERLRVSVPSSGRTLHATAVARDLAVIELEN
jgi:flagella basal body P-ring formation protein FlgA